MKGVIQPDHIPKNKYRLIVAGLPRITFIKVGALEEELEKVDLPDKTAASGGNTKNGEYTATIPTHHRLEREAIENWYQESQDPVSPTYKKTGTLVKESISGLQRASYMLQGSFPFKRNTEDVEMENEGELDTIEWSFSYDKILPR